MAPDNSGPARAQTGPECVEQLIGEVLEAEHLDPDFRAFLLGHRNEVEQALRKIKLYGPGRIDEVIGRVVRDASKRTAPAPRALGHQIHR